MNRIKIKLSRKKRDKEEAARKKAMAGKDKYKYYHCNQLIIITVEIVRKEVTS